VELRRRLILVSLPICLLAGCQGAKETDPKGTYLNAPSAPKGMSNADQAERMGMSRESASSMAGDTVEAKGN